jgi:hypothetical protein
MRRLLMFTVVVLSCLAQDRSRPWNRPLPDAVTQRQSLTRNMENGLYWRLSLTYEGKLMYVRGFSEDFQQAAYGANPDQPSCPGSLDINGDSPETTTC